MSEGLFGRLRGDDPRGARSFAAEPRRAGEDAARTGARIDASLARAHVSADRELAEAVLTSLDADGVLERDGAHVRLPSRAPADAGEEGTPLAGPFGAPSRRPTVPGARGHRVPPGADHGDGPVGSLVRISPDVVLTAAFVERAVEIARPATAASP